MTAGAGGPRAAPSSPWPLSAPESLVLREGVADQGPAALKLAVLELVGRRVVRVESEPRLLGRRTWAAAGGAAPPATGPLAGLARTCLEETAGGRRRLDKVVARHLRAHGRSADRWLSDEVLPALEARGLLAREQRRTLGVFTRTRWSRTPTGDAAAGDLEQRIGELRRGVRSVVEPRDALALVAAAGAAVLLADDAWPLVEDLRRRAADGGGNGGVAGSGGEEDAGGLDIDMDLGSLDLDFDLGSVGDAVDAVDAGVDAGGGGDGGGGDGGGGGD